jgi:DNA-binding FadR family transcriptional regulator
MTSGEHDMQN